METDVYVVCRANSSAPGCREVGAMEYLLAGWAVSQLLVVLWMLFKRFRSLPQLLELARDVRKDDVEKANHTYKETLRIGRKNGLWDGQGLSGRR